MAVQYRKNEISNTNYQDVIDLRNDSLNVLLHVFGSHDKCTAYFCDGNKIGKDYTP